MPISLSGAPLTQNDLAAVSRSALNVVGSPPIGFGTEFTIWPPGGPPRYFSSPPPFLYPPAGYLTTGRTIGQPAAGAPTQGTSPLVVIAIGVGSVAVITLGVLAHKAWQLTAEHGKVWREKSGEFFRGVFLWVLWTLSAFIIGAFVGIQNVMSWFSSDTP